VTSRKRRSKPASARRQVIFSIWRNLIGSWGDWDVAALDAHSCAIDRDNNVWISANGDGMVRNTPTTESSCCKSHEGRVRYGGRARNKNLKFGQGSPQQTAGIACDPENGDVYFADGYGNRRVVVFDKDASFLRQWDARRRPRRWKPVSAAPSLRWFIVSRSAIQGLVYVGDGRRSVQVFDKCNFKRKSGCAPATPTLPTSAGRRWWTGFAGSGAEISLRDDGRNEQVHIWITRVAPSSRASDVPPTSSAAFARPQPRVDSRGNLYVAETNWGRRVNKFRLIA